MPSASWEDVHAAEIAASNDDPVAEILAGQLYMGSHRTPGTVTSFDVLVGVANDRLIKSSDHPNVIVHHFSIKDDGPPELDDRERALNAARLVDMHITGGRRVLVTCLAGYNRSGWIVGLTLLHRGWTPKDAIKLMREKRGSNVLNNEFFEAIVLRRGG